jgi:hypothetical protein
MSTKAMEWVSIDNIFSIQRCVRFKAEMHMAAEAKLWWNIVHMGTWGVLGQDVNSKMHSSVKIVIVSPRTRKTASSKAWKSSLPSCQRNGE